MLSTVLLSARHHATPPAGMEMHSAAAPDTTPQCRSDGETIPASREMTGNRQNFVFADCIFIIHVMFELLSMQDKGERNWIFHASTFERLNDLPGFTLLFTP